MKINFKCKCGGSIIEEVLDEVLQYSTISDIEKLDNDMVALDYGETNTEDGNLSRYQCRNCGLFIKALSPEELYEWLECNDMLKEN